MPDPTAPYSIGQVVTLLKADHQDLSISKIRFLESEGLIEPQRAPSGYRRYSPADIERLRYILDAQKNHYLPLRVIKEQLQARDRGEKLPDPVGSPGTSSARPGQASAVAGLGAPTAGQSGTGPIRLTREALLEASGLTDAALTELERVLIIAPRRGSHFYSRNALIIASAAKRLAEFGIDSRHLRAFKLSADREVGLVEQAIAPHLRRSKGGSEVAAEVTQLVITAHAALIRTAMER